jgi:hypothetical protein
VNGKIYLIGGQTGRMIRRARTYVNTVYELDPAVGVWVTKAPMPTARSSGVAVALNGKIYVAGGRLPRGADFAVYDPAPTLGGAAEPAPPSATTSPARAIDGYIHYAGGRQGNGLSPQMTTRTKSTTHKRRLGATLRPC